MINFQEIGQSLIDEISEQLKLEREKTIESEKSSLKLEGALQGINLYFSKIAEKVQENDNTQPVVQKKAKKSGKK